MNQHDRRNDLRMPLQMVLHEHVAEDARQCISANIGPFGLYLHHLTREHLASAVRSAKKRQLVGVEFRLPGTSEVIWAQGEIRHDQVDPNLHGVGLKFRRIAEVHRELIADYVRTYRVRRLREILSTVRRNRGARS